MKKLNIREVQVGFTDLDWETIGQIIKITEDNGQSIQFHGLIRDFTYFRFCDAHDDFDCYRLEPNYTTLTANEFIEMFGNKDSHKPTKKDEIKGFIELTKAGSDERMLLNYNNFTLSENEGRVLILSNNERRTPIYVKESYDEIKSMIIQNQKL